MKKLIFLAVSAIVMMGITFVACDSKKNIGSVKLKTDIDSVSFMIGQNQGTNFKMQAEQTVNGFPIKGNLDAFLAGFIHAINNAEDTLYLGKNMQAAGEYVNTVFMRAQEQEFAVSKAEADKFLAENGKKPGVITTESGLQYKVITEGKGPKPTETDKVKVNYHGTLLNGEEFDSTKDREPFETEVGGVIEGFKQALQLMPVGSKYTFWIPIELAYFNATGHPMNNKMLIFELEMLEILK